MNVLWIIAGIGIVGIILFFAVLNRLETFQNSTKLSFKKQDAPKIKISKPQRKPKE